MAYEANPIQPPEIESPLADAWNGFHGSLESLQISAVLFENNTIDRQAFEKTKEVHLSAALSLAEEALELDEDHFYDAEEIEPVIIDLADSLYVSHTLFSKKAGIPVTDFCQEITSLHAVFPGMEHLGKAALYPIGAEYRLLLNTNSDLLLSGIQTKKQEKHAARVSYVAGVVGGLAAAFAAKGLLRRFHA